MQAMINQSHIQTDNNTMSLNKSENKTPIGGGTPMVGGGKHSPTIMQLFMKTILAIMIIKSDNFFFGGNIKIMKMVF